LEADAEEFCKMEIDNPFDAIVEPDGRLHLNAFIHSEKGLKVLVAVPRSDRNPSADRPSFWLTLKISGGDKLKMEMRHLLSRPLDLDVRVSI